MSAGNLYRYFPSKKAIIAGIAERDPLRGWRRNSRAPTCHRGFLPCSKAWRVTTSPFARSSR